jgi:hypothetical protein
MSKMNHNKASLKLENVMERKYLQKYQLFHAKDLKVHISQFIVFSLASFHVD